LERKIILGHPDPDDRQPTLETGEGGRRRVREIDKGTNRVRGCCWQDDFWKGPPVEDRAVSELEQEGKQVTLGPRQHRDPDTLDCEL
jgi:hypothetical protein